jgi:energy-converting hydrogenase A subunit K
VRDKMKGYVYFFTIACIIAVIYCILVNLLQVNVIPIVLVFGLILIMAISTINKKIAHKMEDIEVLFMLLVLAFFAYTLYKLYIPV